MLETILWIIGSYFFIVFVAAPLVVPHLRRVRVPEQIPDEVQAAVDHLLRDHPGQVEFLQAVLDLIRSRYTVRWWQHLRYPWILFRRNIATIWGQEGEIQSCNVLNFVMKTMLVTSGRFTNDQVQSHLTFYRWNIHQYLAVATDRGLVYVDPWGYLARRTELGEYASGFSTKGAPLGL